MTSRPLFTSRSKVLEALVGDRRNPASAEPVQSENPSNGLSRVGKTKNFSLHPTARAWKIGMCRSRVTVGRLPTSRRARRASAGVFTFCSCVSEFPLQGERLCDD